jgi:hypothetical protein
MQGLAAHGASFLTVQYGPSDRDQHWPTSEQEPAALHVAGARLGNGSGGAQVGLG